MLTCYGHRIRLPHSDLAYLAFRLAIQEALSDIELALDMEEEPEPPIGYLAEVPFLQQVPLPVQVDLLAETWARHYNAEPIEASLLDAAVVYAACRTAGRIAADEPEVAVAMFRSGPRSLTARILHRASYRLDDLFEEFWDDHDFLMIEDWQDLPPDQATRLKELMRLPDEEIEPMYAALERWRVSPEVAGNLAGLMTDAEIAAALPLLNNNVWPPRPKLGDEPDDEYDWVTGFEDRYHDLLVGPCAPDTAAELACRLVWQVRVRNLGDFHCTYDEWVEHLREDVMSAVEQTPEQSVAFTQDDAEIAKDVTLATSTGLEDGTRIERRGGWVVIDSFYSYLADPEDAAWVTDPDDEDMPAARFDTPEAAYRAWMRSEEVAAAGAKRRAEALGKLGR